MKSAAAIRGRAGCGKLQGRPLPSAYAATGEEGQGSGGGGRGHDTESGSLLRGSMEMSSLLEEGREASAPR